MCAKASSENDAESDEYRWRRFTNYKLNADELKSTPLLSKSLNLFKIWFQEYKTKDWYVELYEFRRYIDDIDKVYARYSEMVAQNPELENFGEDILQNTKLKMYSAKVKQQKYPIIFLFTSQLGHTEWFHYAIDNSVIPREERREKQFDEFFVVDEEDRLEERWNDWSNLPPLSKLQCLRAYLVRQMRELLSFEIKHCAINSENPPARILEGTVYRCESLKKEDIQYFQSNQRNITDIFFGLPFLSTSTSESVAKRFLKASTDTIPVMFRFQIFNIPENKMIEYKRFYPQESIFLYKAVNICQLSRFPNEEEVLLLSPHVLILNCAMDQGKKFFIVDLLTTCLIQNLPSNVNHNLELFNKWIGRLNEMKNSSNNVIEKTTIQSLIEIMEDFKSGEFGHASAAHLYVLQNMAMFQNAEGYFRDHGMASQIAVCKKVLANLVRLEHVMREVR